MATPFSRTCRSLVNDTSRYALLVWGLVVVLLAAWLSWLLFAKVTVYELSQSARLEVQQAAHPVAALLPGKILITSVRLGRHVTAGEVLVELDTRSERLRLAEEQARLESIPPQLLAIERQLADEERAAERAQTAASSAIEQARARSRESLAAANFAEENSSRIAQLSSSGRVAEIEVLRARAETMKAKSAADAFSFEIERLTADESGKADQRRAASQSLRRQIAELEGQSELAMATIARLRQDIEKHVLRAPIAGEIGEAPSLDVGAFVDEGDVVASIVPSGGLKVVADFDPARVLGRVVPGQKAHMRLDGFPWAQFGTVAIEVDRVSSEIRDGRVRIELALLADEDSSRLRHGLPGSVEVEVEQTTPFLLALRAAGQMMTRPARVTPLAGRAESASTVAPLDGRDEGDSVAFGQRTRPAQARQTARTSESDP
jgi:membrane fusion protein (multidrug efflux system)